MYKIFIENSKLVKFLVVDTLVSGRERKRQEKEREYMCVCVCVCVCVNETGSRMKGKKSIFLSLATFHTSKLVKTDLSSFASSHTTQGVVGNAQVWLHSRWRHYLLARTNCSKERLLKLSPFRYRKANSIGGFPRTFLHGLTFVSSGIHISL